MKSIKKWGARLGVLLITLVILFAGYIYIAMRRALPKANGTLTINGLTEPVEVVRDEWGTIHIYAENEHDLFFAQGFATAQDRMFQMEIFRRYPAGRLSELLGQGAFWNDQYFRNWRMVEAAELIWEEMDEESKTVLQAYTDGVNAYLEENKRSLPIEYTILQFKPEPWTPVDSLVFGNAISWQLSSNHRLEFLRARLVSVVGEDGMNFLLRYTADDTPITVPPSANNYAGFAQSDLTLFSPVDDILGTPIDGIGSNGWVVNGDMTESGMPIIANDIHIGLTMPAIWHAVGLHGGDFDVVGFTLPGVPGIISGHNEDIAWGMTNLGPDTQDAYLEELDDLENPTQYMYDGEWVDLEVVTETFNVRGKDPVTVEYLLTQHGPILNYPFEDPENEPPISLRWTQYEGSTLFSSILALNKASNWDEFRSALSMWDSPGQNVFYADLDGNIGYQATGKIPIRPNGNGRIPVPGWTSENEWQGYIPFEEMPFAYNPTEGMLLSANHRIEPEGYPYYISDSYTPGYRAQQIETLLNEYAPLTIEDMALIQEDTYSPQAALFIDYLAIVEPQTPLEEEALAIVQGWDLHANVEGAGTTIYDTWHIQLLTNLITDELGEDTAQWFIGGVYLRHSKQHVPMLQEIMVQPDHEWFDNINTPEVETRDDLIQQSFEEAVAQLAERYGEDTSNWEWGKVHTATFPHQPFNQIPVLRNYFNAGPYSVGGGNYAITSNGYTQTDPFDVRLISSARHIIDMSNFATAEMAGSTGQNMNMLSPHRTDINDMWQQGLTFPMSFTRADVESVQESVLVLEPAE